MLVIAGFPRTENSYKLTMQTPLLSRAVRRQSGSALKPFIVTLGIVLVFVSAARLAKAADLYGPDETVVDIFGSASVGQETIDHFSSSRVHHDSRLGAGAGISYFCTRYLGVGVDAYSEDVRHSFVDSLSGNVIARFPIGQTGLAPYAFGGGGHQFDLNNLWFGQVGGGLEFRFTPRFGIFADARYVVVEKTDNYGVGRAGLRFAF